MKKYISVPVLLFMVAWASAQSIDKQLFSEKYIKQKMLNASEWQLRHPKHNPRDWTNGAFYAGLFKAWQTTKADHIYRAMMGIGSEQKWQPYRRWFHADDIAVCQMYLDLYAREQNPEMIRPTVDTLQRFIHEPYPTKGIEKIKLWWCDALFMAPPVFAKLAKATGNTDYLKYNDQFYKECYDLLYNKEEQLFARDLNYVIKPDGSGRREKNGKRIFWSRGNGWVMGGLALLMENLPANYPQRPFYETLFKEMAARIVTLQQPDGLWRASLLDPDAYPGGEVSGSGFFCYALAWGINNGLLDKSYVPAVEKAWVALTKCVNKEGRVGWVQPIGADPRANFSADSWEVYGTGAFLLAGSEVIKWNEKEARYPSLDNQKIDGYKGIWFTLGQFSEYGDKYSGGLGTYTAKHIPLAIYAPTVNKTFFVYGGIADDRKSNSDIAGFKGKSEGDYLLCMIGSYDHKTQTVSKPTVVYDKKGVFDPHDNPSIALDSDGYIWVFVSGRGRGRMGLIYKSEQPYSIEKFTLASKREVTYPQPKYVEGNGFLHLFTKYMGTRLLYFNTSKDGYTWTADQQLAAIKRPGDKNGGHYQISGQWGGKIVFFFNWHPNGNVDQRTNIYYMQTTDFGKTWTKVDGTPVTVPVTRVDDNTLLKEFFSKGENVYIKDVAFDKDGNPAALYVSGKGYKPGPENGEKQWQIMYWNGKEWENHLVATSDHNYDTGSLWIENNKWIVVGPTQNTPQQYGGGGELVMWESKDKGKTWKKARQVTKDSARNHNYVRKVADGVDPFKYFWGDGNPASRSKSYLYFGDSKGNVWQLPYHMSEEAEKPLRGQRKD